MRRPHSRLLGPILGLTLLAAALIVPTTAAAATTNCDEGRWPASTQGTPATWKAGARAGDYIWHNANGWHVRVTHPGSGRAVFSGRIVSDAPLTVTPLKLEAGDTLTLSADKLTLTYRFVNHGRIDGFDFRTACATLLKVKGSMAGTKLPIGRIWIGRAGHHPLSNPFAIGRAG